MVDFFPSTLNLSVSSGAASVVALKVAAAAEIIASLNIFFPSP